MEVAIGEYGTDMDMLADAAQNRIKQINDKTNSKTSKCCFYVD